MHLDSGIALHSWRDISLVAPWVNCTQVTLQVSAGKSSPEKVPSSLLGQSQEPSCSQRVVQTLLWNWRETKHSLFCTLWSREGQAVLSIWVVLHILDIVSMAITLVWSEHLPMTGSHNYLSFREHLKTAPQALHKKPSESLHLRWCSDKSIRNRPQRQPWVGVTGWMYWSDIELLRQLLPTLCFKEHLDHGWWWKDHVYTSCTSQIPITKSFGLKRRSRIPPLLLAWQFALRNSCLAA